MPAAGLCLFISDLHGTKAWLRLITSMNPWGSSRVVPGDRCRLLGVAMSAAFARADARAAHRARLCAGQTVVASVNGTRTDGAGILIANGGRASGLTTMKKGRVSPGALHRPVRAGAAVVAGGLNFASAVLAAQPWGLLLTGVKGTCGAATWPSSMNHRSP